MIFPRSAHTCGIFYSDRHDGRPVIVTVGSYKGSGQRKSEYWDFTRPGSKWTLSSKSTSKTLNGYHY